jgi:UDP-glucose 4-epimerase
MKKVLVTGGAGYIGSHTVVSLVKSGYFPVIVDNFSNSDYSVIDNLKKILRNKFYLIEKDISNLSDKLNIEEEIEAIIHFAAFKSTFESISNPLKYYNNNLNSLIWSLDFMKEKGIKNFIFSSSATVYGEPGEIPIKETTPTKESNTPYGTTKQIGEKIIDDFFKSNNVINVVKLRYFNPIGADKSGLIGEIPNGVPNNLLPYLLDVASGEREILNVFGSDWDTPDGSCIRDFIHVEDLANAHTKVLDWMIDKSNINEIFNVGTGRGVSVFELIDCFEKCTNQKINYKVVDRRSGDIGEVWADVTKIREIVGWKSQLTLEDALKDSWNFKLNHLA